ncbi:[FeFe] hydrogenase H-cluster radical SAM maturase HydG [Cloacibacillus porcorum]|uniref:[FeFe] hydrogenase H-cluster radical SAM maturase HydG n=1 Tax=Cloacibacillus porcorum TaxID=1197717 RepID=UPI0014599767|nr:[FeFe] hydrogenase H-cluster radical SAM maturase HydG [Cloacibacillus porcorum]MCC8183858.1 [FeFe] hydrogenase H-cluster radical SAM maturase HydG [Cloacibacillus porcorum]MCI5864691.1 [FeFe] hydrogenase H-cluster radical SAM maturase HydG [Cloacibacillus porcorum]MDD7648047.1 [FeFe] hydrogenase H-cluster radical SAM maturase HydG [Cloacibacillus porcorum]MDY4094612.1 [FeFe] hydrogenase H-cluster radical SAM maturase HydG [Cloacibacillus porcorum]MDY5391150.1 [FeFe] hydrogenase H-cluster r
MYSKTEFQDSSFIDDAEILSSLAEAKETAKDAGAVRAILDKARSCNGLTHREAAVLLEIDDPQLEHELYALAKEIKERIYGRRIVLFAPLYVANHCINGCVYCGFHAGNNAMCRKKLTMEEIDQEADAILALGHKRIAMEAGEDPVNIPLDYIIECMKRVYAYKNSRGDSIRRINVNIAATTVEEYRRLKAAEIGTFILFQETFHRPTYAKMHPKGPKSNYDWHTTALHRAQEGGIDDVGTGVLYGLYDYKYETVAQLLYAESLEKMCGVGPHTISVPRMREAEGVDMEKFPYLPTDEQFLRIIAVIRVATPYTGMILSTRETPETRRRALDLGISQVSAGSCTGIGGYHKEIGQPEQPDTAQFKVSDERTPDEVLTWLCEDGYIPSYCTACYRQGRTGDRFMSLAKSGQIRNICQPNALLTFKEYLIGYGSDHLKELGEKVIAGEVEKIPSDKIKTLTKERLHKLEEGAQDLYF